MRSSYIPLTPEESEVCKLEARVQACKKSLFFIEGLEGYSREDFEFMKNIIHDRKPLFSSELSDKFSKALPTLQDTPFQEIEERRAQHPDARYIEDFISDDLKERWMQTKVKFIKAYYFWKVVHNQATCSRLDALHNFMVVHDDDLWRTILIALENAEPKIIIKIPEREKFVRPKIGDSIIVDRGVIDREIREALHLLGNEKQDQQNKR